MVKGLKKKFNLKNLLISKGSRFQKGFKNREKPLEEHLLEKKAYIYHSKAKEWHNTCDDSLLFYRDDNLIFAAVLDGISGAENGNITSETLVENLAYALKTYYRNLIKDELSMTSALVQIVDGLIKIARKIEDGGSTLSLVAISNGKGRAINIGDSAIFCFSKKEKKVKVTQIAPEAMELKRKMKIDEYLDIRHLVLNPLGSSTVSYTLTSFPVKDKDVFVLATDGLLDNLPLIINKNETILENGKETLLGFFVLSNCDYYKFGKRAVEYVNAQIDDLLTPVMESPEKFFSFPRYYEIEEGFYKVIEPKDDDISLIVFEV